MKPLERDRSILEHIVSYCGQIDQTIQRFGDDYTTFSTDAIYRSACRSLHPTDRGARWKIK